MEKPTIQQEIKKFFQFFECRDYILEKYKDSITSSQMRKFWSYLCEYKGISNDSYFGFGLESWDRPKDEGLAEIWDLFKNEFGNNKKYIEFYVSW